MIDISSVAGYKDKTLELELVSRQEGSPTIIFSSGFMSANDQEWAEFISNEFPTHQILRVKWKSGGYRDLIKALAGGLGESLLINGALSVAAPVVSSFIPIVGPLIALKNVRNAGLVLRARNLWVSARKESEAAGKQLANVLNRASLGYRQGVHSRPAPVILMGHSLGARLMVNCLHNVYNGEIERAIFLGGAADIDCAEAMSAACKTSRPSLNVNCMRDDVLKWLYRLGNLSLNGAIGRAEIGGGYLNFDVTHAVSGHTNYCNNSYIAKIIREEAIESLKYAAVLKSEVSS